MNSVSAYAHEDIEMATGLLILTISVLLLVYWFHYACSLLLGAKRESNRIAYVAAVNGLSFLEVEAQLKIGEIGLDVLAKTLDHDYQVLLYLLRNTRGRELAWMESRLLLWHHLVLRIWYLCVRRISAERGRKALEERSRILNYLAHQMSRPAARQVAA